jgi:hypothetical protein
MINSNIIISYEEIISKYNKLDSFYVSILKGIYGKETNSSIVFFKTEKFINLNSCNNLSGLNYYYNKIGVYIFLDKNKVPIYIGVAGEINSKHSLQGRLKKQLNCNQSNSTISKNIAVIETIFQNREMNNGLNTPKNLLLEYAPNFLVIEVGDIGDNEAVKKALELEVFLIALFNSKYNK